MFVILLTLFAAAAASSDDYFFTNELTKGVLWFQDNQTVVTTNVVTIPAGQVQTHLYYNVDYICLPLPDGPTDIVKLDVEVQSNERRVLIEISKYLEDANITRIDLPLGLSEAKAIIKATCATIWKLNKGNGKSAPVWRPRNASNDRISRS